MDTSENDRPSVAADPPTNVLWTSGWDSTFRVVELLLQGKQVQPWYVVFDVTPRPSTKRELKTMRKIRAALASKYPQTQALLLPTKLVRESSLPVRSELYGAANRLRASRGSVPSQYPVLATLLEKLGEPMEVGVELGGHAFHLLEQDIVVDSVTGRQSVGADADPDLVAIFGRMELPLFWISKPAMGETAAERGFDDIMEMTWFCASPVMGTPCGYCAPCRTTRAYGMERRVGKQTKSKHLAYKAIWALRRTPPRAAIRKIASRLREALVVVEGLVKT